MTGDEPFSREEAIIILCRVVARWAEEMGAEGDAQAVRRAEDILKRELRTVYCGGCGRKLLERVTVEDADA